MARPNTKKLCFIFPGDVRREIRNVIAFDVINFCRYVSYEIKHSNLFRLFRLMSLYKSQVYLQNFKNLVNETK